MEEIKLKYSELSAWDRASCLDYLNFIIIENLGKKITIDEKYAENIVKYWDFVQNPNSTLNNDGTISINGYKVHVSKQ